MKRPLQSLMPLLLCSLSAIALVATALNPGVGAQAPPAELEVMLAIDRSGSMRSAMDATKAAANEFVVTMPAQVPVGIVVFGDVVTVLTPPTTDRAALADLINGITAQGDTALYDAVVTATQQFAPTTANKVLVLLSDGKDDGSAGTLEAAIAAVEGVTVEAISLTTSETDINSLTALGTVTPADDAAGVLAAYTRVVGLIAAQVTPTTVVGTAAPTTLPAATSVPTTAAGTATTLAPATSGPEAGSSNEISKTPLLLGGLGVFVGLLSLGLLLFPRARVSKARLGIKKPRSVSAFGQRTISAVDEALERRGQRADFATTLSVAGISMQPGEFIGTVGVVALVGGLVGFAAGGALWGLLTAVLVCMAVRFYVQRSKAKRQAAFADQLPDVLRLVTTSLRSGFGLTQALDTVAEEAEEPARSEFAHVLVEARLGRDLSDAMNALSRRIGSRDLEWVVAAIDINRDTGGNLSEILNTVGETIRERQRMARQVATLTAEGRLSARILTAVPLLVALWQWRSNPEQFELLTHGGGLVALIIAGVLLLLGTFWTSRIVNSLSL